MGMEPLQATMFTQQIEHGFQWLLLNPRLAKEKCKQQPSRKSFKGLKSDLPENDKGMLAQSWWE